MHLQIVKIGFIFKLRKRLSEYRTLAMASLKDISRQCGVSVATVSKALNNHTDISEGTRERVRKAAKELGYSPNFSARALKTNKTHGIGVLFVDEARSGLTHDYFAGVLDSFKSTVEDKGYDITFINCSKKQPNRMTFLEHVRYHGFDGVVIACIDFNAPEVAELVQSDIPIVTIDHVFNNKIAIMSDNITGMTALTDYCISKGHKKIAYLHGEPSTVTTARLTGFYRATDKKGIVIPDEYVVGTKYRDTVGTYKETLKLLKMKDRPTCILYPDDFAALGGINAIREMGLRIPEDISVAGYDGIKAIIDREPQLTTVLQATDLIGERAAKKLISLIEKPKTTIIEQVVIPGTLKEGRTIADLTK